jgi:hypothetical protein
MTLVIYALAFGVAATIASQFSSARRYERFLGHLQNSVSYTVQGFIFQTFVFAVPAYLLLLIWHYVF